MPANPRNTVPPSGLAPVPTRKLFGRVLVKESNVPLPDLVVQFFEVDARSDSARPKALTPKSVDSFTTRLGSVLTDTRGYFELAVDTEVAKRFGTNKFADPVVVVSAPEDPDPKTRVPKPPANLVLHISYVPRWNAGISEAYVIRIEQGVLDALGIPSRENRADGTDAGAMVDAFAAELATSSTQRGRLRGIIQQRAIALRKQQDAKAAAASALVIGLGQKPLRGHPGYFLDSSQNAAKVHDAAMTTGMKRMAAYDRPLTLNLTRESLKDLGLSIDSQGSVSGAVQAPVLQARLGSATSGMGSVRERDLPQPIESATVLPAPAPKQAELAREGDGSPWSVVVDRTIGQIDGLQPAGAIGIRQDIAQLKADLKELRLSAGPADTTAFHDFHDLQIAFKHVWAHAFDESLRDHVEQMYKEFTRLYDAAGLELPPLPAIQDLNDLLAFKKKAEDAVTALGGPPPAKKLPPLDLHFPVIGGSSPSPATDTTDEDLMKLRVACAFPEALTWWGYLSLEQKVQLKTQADIILTASSPEDAKGRARVTADFIINHPGAAPGRLATMTIELGRMLSEPYAFDVFAPNTYNFGILVTYRQRWEPKDYQAGNLVATIPLAPGETRKFSKRKVVKTSRAVKELEKSMQSQSETRTEDNRAEAEIMKKASTATNFKMSSHGSFNVGIGSIDAGSEFALDQQQHSASTKKEFHEATLKAAQEYRLERSIEVDTSVSTETEETSSGEISNPNNEITVTYLFYELQRQYQIHERLHRARPVILVAQDVPAPHQIDEAWLLGHQWILGRVLLDDSLRPALDYLSSGFAGDEVSNEVLKSTWLKAMAVVEKLEGLVEEQLAMRAALRESLVQTALAKDSVPHMPTALKIFTMGIDPSDSTSDLLEAQRKAAETRLQYVEEALADSQTKLRGASDQLAQASRDYSAALQRQFSRHTAIDQLRLHVKQNILFYMQAIWDHEPPDQRFFRLYNKPVVWPEPSTGCTFKAASPAPTVSASAKATLAKGASAAAGLSGTSALATTYDLDWSSGGGLRVRPAQTYTVALTPTCGPVVGTSPPRELVEVADLDNPLGYKGNYIIFPLRESCYLTDFMMREYVDEYFGARDPDDAGNYTIEELEDLFAAALTDPNVPASEKTRWRDLLTRRLTEARVTSDLIVVPTGQLFIEALPGTHPVLEDFKLLHRAEDVLKVKADVRHAELENLRFAGRLVKGQLSDPDIDKKIVVKSDGDVTANT